ncbi:MAG: hypothetical protein WCA46_28225 [Actinocatenispora sp.]
MPWPTTAFGAPARPEYREPHPVRSGAVWAGLGCAALWFVMFAAVSWNLRAYVWGAVIAGVLALVTSLVLARYGDRGVAVGIAGATGVGLGIAGVIVLSSALNGHWLLW